MTLLVLHLVRRSDELGSLERLLDELDRGHPAIELAGDPRIAGGSAADGSRRRGVSCQGRAGQTGWAEMITWPGW